MGLCNIQVMPPNMPQHLVNAGKRGVIFLYKEIAVRGCKNLVFTSQTIDIKFWK